MTEKKKWSFEEDLKNKKWIEIYLCKFEKFMTQVRNEDLILTWSPIHKSLFDHPRWLACKKHPKAQYLYLRLHGACTSPTGCLLVSYQVLTAWLHLPTRDILAAIKKLEQVGLVACFEVLEIRDKTRQDKTNRTKQPTPPPQLPLMPSPFPKEPPQQQQAAQVNVAPPPKFTKTITRRSMAKYASPSDVETVEVLDEEAWVLAMYQLDGITKVAKQFNQDVALLKKFMGDNPNLTDTDLCRIYKNRAELLQHEVSDDFHRKGMGPFKILNYAASTYLSEEFPLDRFAAVSTQAAPVNPELFASEAALLKQYKEDLVAELRSKK